MLTALLPLLSGILSHIPAEQGPVVPKPATPAPAPEQRFVGLNLPAPKPEETPPNTGVGGDKQVDAGVPVGGAVAPGQPSPQPATTVIDEAAFYTIDPNNPDLARVVGAQVREMAHRGRQVDGLQSDLHTTQNERDALQQQLTTATAELQILRTNQVVATQLAQAGVSQQAQPPPAPVTPPSVLPQQGQGTVEPPDVYERMAADWSPGNAPPPTAYGYTGQEPPGQPPSVPGQQTQLPVQPQQGAALVNDPRAFAQELLPVISQLVKAELGNIPQLVQQQTQSGFQQLQQDQQARTQVANTLSQGREQRAQGLRDIGMDPGVIQNTVELEDGARVLEREAEGLLATNTPENVVMAQEKLRQAAVFTSTASNNRVQAQMTYQNGQQQRQFVSQIETNPYQAVGMQPPLPPDYTLTEPRAIANENANKLNMAMKLVEDRERLEGAAGRM